MKYILFYAIWTLSSTGETLAIDSGKIEQENKAVCGSSLLSLQTMWMSTTSKGIFECYPKGKDND